MIKNYGIMILREGSVLYHASDKIELFNSNKYSFLFCSFHPSDYGANHYYIHNFRLKRDVKLFFMIKDIRHKGITILNSSFKNLIDHNKVSLNIIKNNKKFEFIKKLKNNKFDGWFSSINNSSTGVEVALFCNENVYEKISSSKLELNWTNYNNNENVQYFNYGNKYQLSTIMKPIKLIINIKYKDMIEQIKTKLYRNDIFIPKSIFDIIINNADIIYFNEDNNIINANNTIKKYN